MFKKYSLVDIFKIFFNLGLAILLIVGVLLSSEYLCNEIIVSGLIIASMLLLIIGFIAKEKDKESIYKLCVLSIYIGIVLVFAYYVLARLGYSKMFKNPEKLKEWILKSGQWGEIIFVLIQFLQVTFIPIPTAIVVIAGSEIFSFGKTLFLSVIGLMIGSMVAFVLGKVFGNKLVRWLIGDKALKKYQSIVKGRDKTILTLMFIFPMFPDDLLCMVAGLTNMGYFSFFMLQLITRPLSVSGTLITKEGLLKLVPFSGWGIPVWIAIVVVIVIGFLLALKIGDKIELYMLKFMGKIARKDYVSIMYPVKYGEVPVHPAIHENTIILLKESC